MFFQVFKDDILEFPSSLIANVNDIPGILCDCKSGNTVRNYYCGFLRWKKMSKLHWISDGDVLPAKPIHVVLYLTCLMQHNSRSGPINQAFYSIRWVHYIVSVLSPTEYYKRPHISPSFPYICKERREEYDQWLDVVLIKHM